MKSNPVAEEVTKRECGESGLDRLCTRRQVLIWGGASVIALSALSSAFAHDAGRPLIIMEKAQGMVISDPVLCVGCGRCELACREFNDGRAAPTLSRIRVDRNINFGPQGHKAWRTGHGNFGDGLIIQDLCNNAPTLCPAPTFVRKMRLSYRP